MSQDKILIRGPALRSKSNPKAKRVRKSKSQSQHHHHRTGGPSTTTDTPAPIPSSSKSIYPSNRDSCSPSNPIPSTGREDNTMDPVHKLEEPFTNPSTPSPKSTSSIPNKPIPPPHQLSYFPEAEPDLIAQTYVRELQIVHITRQAGTPSPIPLCPFILSHLEPHIVPHMPLRIHHMPHYLFYFQYVLKETIITPTKTFDLYAAIFSMANQRDPNHIPTILGTGITEPYLAQLQANIKEETDHLKERIISYGRTVSFLDR